MQKLSYQTNRQLLRCPSTTNYQENIKHGTSTTINTSCSSIQSVDDEYRKLAIKWLLQFDRKITKDTNYLSIWYLQVITKNGLSLKQSNWQLTAASIMLFASKMNQIYPPSVGSILKRCKQTTPIVTKQSIIQMQGKILNLLSFNVAIQSPYNILSQILTDSKKDIQQCEKLLKIVIYNKQINQQQSQILAYAIIYLICRTKIDNLIQGEIRMKVKITAQKMYNYYKDVRKNYQNQKAKEKNTSAQTKNYTSSESHKAIPTKPSQQYGLASSKQNTSPVDVYSSIGSSYNINDHNSITKKSSQNITPLSRASSYKFIPKYKPFGESTNLMGKQKKLFHCVSKDDLKENYKNMYFYA